MRPELQLCPCCAAHLRVPDELHIMRCNNCDGELVFLNKGGVRGLALLPNVNGVIPYSHPAQRGRVIPGNLDGRELFEFRRRIALHHAARKERFWGSLFFAGIVLLALAGVTGIVGAGCVTSATPENAETAALVCLGAILSLPLISYVALHFHAHARLARETVRRWMG